MLAAAGGAGGGDGGCDGGGGSAAMAVELLHACQEDISPVFPNSIFCLSCLS